jgi:hypothetical protein
VHLNPLARDAYASQFDQNQLSALKENAQNYYLTGYLGARLSMGFHRNLKPTEKAGGRGKKTMT